MFHLVKMEHQNGTQRAMWHGLRRTIGVFVSVFAYFAYGMRDALLGRMTMLTAFLLYGETANGSEYRLVYFKVL